MVNQPCMTFVIPTFNRPRMLQEAVESCLGQTVSVDVVVVDHGSSVETQRVCERFPSTVTVVRREKDSGPIFAWLDGVLHASTEFVNLHFDDDLKNPRFAEVCMGLMQDGVGMVFTQARTSGALGEPTSSVAFQGWFPQSSVYSSRQFTRFFRETLVSPCAAIYRRQHLIDALYVGRLPNQVFDYHGVGPDLLLQLFALRNYPSIGYVAEPLTYFRAHPGSITTDAETSGREADLVRAYDEARLAILDLLVVRFVRGLKIQQAALFGPRKVARLRKRFRKLIQRHAATWRYALSKIASQRH
jgi:glycosyltransferase involved in cell wall biosynthesis